MNAIVDLKDLTLAELEDLVASWHQPRFRARQLLKWVYKGVLDFGDMTDVSRTFREELKFRARLSDLTLTARQVSRDGTQKFRWLLEDGACIESVLIPEEDHSTLCLSSQVGCALGCRFCLTARQGLTRNLRPAEMVNQVPPATASCPSTGAIPSRPSWRPAGLSRWPATGALPLPTCCWPGLMTTPPWPGS
ncbi:MAG: hypothetical protein P8X58_02280 [Syntrophobacterales bacterium]